MYERMLCKDDKPSLGEMAAYCGECEMMFYGLSDFLSENFHTSQEIRFPYGDTYGWSVCHRKKKKLICDIFAEEQAFCVMLRLSDEQLMKVYPQLSEYSKECIDHRYPCGNGGWIHYRVCCQQHMNDVKKLLAIKCKN